jgi:hypothetical protein
MHLRARLPCAGRAEDDREEQLERMRKQEKDKKSKSRGKGGFVLDD